MGMFDRLDANNDGFYETYVEVETEGPHVIVRLLDEGLGELQPVFVHFLGSK